MIGTHLEHLLKPTNIAFMRIAKRAEQQDDAVLQKTFVDFGAVFAAFSSIDHQIVYGRRGTGKTHLLSYLRQMRRDAGEVAIQLDMRNIGSAGGLYGDVTIPLSQRATRMLVDVLAAIHAGLMEQAVEHDSRVDLGAAGPALDELFEAHTAVRVVGTTTVETSTSAETAANAESALGFGFDGKRPRFDMSLKTLDAERAMVAAKKVVDGVEAHRVNFGSVNSALRKVIDTLPNKRFWILIDEWSEVPPDIQPLLAELLRRAVLPTKGTTVKIAAIEQRSRFLIAGGSAGHLGIEVGADVAAGLNLDDYMVFDNDEEKAVAFFKVLFLKHVQAALESEKVPPPQTVAELISQGFTQGNAFDEVVRACEGVPRDAINILGMAARRATDETISVGTVRAAAQQWYLASKDSPVSADQRAKLLLQWIVDRVLKERQAKAFLLEAGRRDRLIDFLYDERVLHVLRKGMSAKDAPGARFNVYGIDYGCYVDLINTAKAPKGMLDLGIEAPEISVDVPRTDLRSIRRCILNLDEFYAQEMPAAAAARN